MRTAKRRLRAYLLRILRLKGAPWKIAGGFSFGAAVNFFPAFGVAIPLAYFIGVFSRTNGTASLMGNLFFKPLWPFFFYLDLVTGYAILGRHGENLERMVHGIAHFNWVIIGKVGGAFFLGAVLNTLLFVAVISGLFAYILKRHKPWLIQRLRSR